MLLLINFSVQLAPQHTKNNTFVECFLLLRYSLVSKNVTIHDMLYIQKYVVDVLGKFGMARVPTSCQLWFVPPHTLYHSNFLHFPIYSSLSLLFSLGKDLTLLCPWLFYYTNTLTQDSRSNRKVPIHLRVSYNNRVLYVLADGEQTCYISTHLQYLIL